ncbi:MAG: transpeptidase family protein [Myxococcales bacterium]|nr:transpeptidase family protein [Myxococcales bacterium]
MSSRLRKISLVDRDGPSPRARYQRTRRRAQVVVLICGLWLLACVGGAAFHVAHVDEVRRYAEQNSTYHRKVRTRRGDVRDRHGVTLAADVRTEHLTCDPRWVRPNRPNARKLKDSHPDVRRTRRQVAKRIAKITGASRSDVLKRLSRKRAFSYLVKDLSIDQSRAIRALRKDGKLPGVGIEQGFARYYPNHKLAGSLIGRRNWSGNVERSFDSQLRGQTVEIRAHKNRDAERMYFHGAPDSTHFGGRSLTLTIDEKIQAVAEHQLVAGVREGRAKFGIAVVMDVHTGEILAMAQTPQVDPNETKRIPRQAMRNRAISEQFEPGSTLKVLTYAAALQEDKVKPHTHFNAAGGFRVPGKLIRDSHSHGDLTATECIKVSSNVCLAKIAWRLKKDKLEKYLRAFGIGRRTDVGLVGEIAGQLSNSKYWRPVKFANIAFGQGVAVTALQVVNAFSVIGNGGVFRRPRLLHSVRTADGTLTQPFEVERGRRVLSRKVSRQVVDAMATVCEKGGTARRGRLDNYKMAGKTGTAQQYDPKGGYSKTHWVASFIGLVPAEKPRLAIFVAIDTPMKRHKKYPSIIIRTGGAIAAPVVREIARFALPYLGVPASPGAPYLAFDDPAKARERAEKRRARALAKLARNKPAEADEVDQPTAPLAALRPGRLRVPDLRGLPLPQAMDRLSREGLAVRAKGSGVVLTQRPAAGVMVKQGHAVRLRLARISAVASAESYAQEDRP